MKPLLLTLLAVLLSTTLRAEPAAPAAGAGPQTAWRELFNGKDLNGWKANVSPESWSLVDGTIRANAVKTSSHLFFAGDSAGGFEKFKDFELEVETRSEANANSGIFIHADLETMPDGQRLHNGYEIQLNSSAVEKRKTGSLYAVVDLDKSPVDESQWFKVLIRVKGKRITVLVNGAQVVDYTEPENLQRPKEREGRRLNPAGAGIALQAHDPKSIFYFKNIRLRPLDSARPAIGTLPVERVLFLGNSITLHSPAPDIGWTGNWGMAASAENKDYVHLLTADLAAAAGAAPQILVKNTADFERGAATFDPGVRLKPELEFKADLVILALGENVPEPATEEARAAFAGGFARLLAALKAGGAPAIFVRSCFWPHAVKDGIMRKAAEDAGATFVDIAPLGSDPKNAASAERKIDHAGVAGHPGDAGMRALADALLSAIKKKAGV